jgi:hypothetical protein
MPAIISDSKQQQALQQVSDGLKAVADINTMLDIAAKDNAFTVSAKSRKKPAIVVDEQAATRIQSAMKNFREKMVKKIRDTAERQRIALSEEDEAILNWGVSPVAAEATEDEDSDDGLVNEANTPENGFTPEESEPQEDAEIGRPFFFN